MTKNELEKVKLSLPSWDKQSDADKKLSRELDCREMINSILIYGYLDNTIDEIYEDRYLRNYKKDISEERIKELIKEQQEDLKKSKINTDVYTDGEGVTYNSVDWYDEDDSEKQEESKQLNESLDDRYEVWQKYFEDGEPAKAEYVQSFDTYEEASKFAEGLNKDSNCEAWVIDKSKNELKELNNSIKIGDRVKIVNSNDLHNNKKGEVTYKDDEIITVKLDNGRSFNYNYNQVIKESKELRKYNSRLYGVYDIDKEKYEEVGSLEDMREKVESEKEEVEGDKEDEPKDDKKDININITVKNESNEEDILIVNNIEDYIDITEDREQWDYPIEDKDEALANNDYLVLNKADNRIYEVTENEYKYIKQKLNKTEEKQYDTMAFAQLLPMSFTDMVDNDIYETIDEWEDDYTIDDVTDYYTDMFMKYIEGDEEAVEEFNKDLAKEYIEYKLSKLTESESELSNDWKENVRQIKNGKFVESLDKRIELLSKVFAQYPDIIEEDEDYLNGLSLEELITELKTRGWEDILEENKDLKIDRTWDITVQSIDGIIEDINDEMDELHNKIHKIYDKYKTSKEADKDEELSLLMEQLGNLIYKLNKIKDIYNKALQDVLNIIDKKEENKEIKTESVTKPNNLDDDFLEYLLSETEINRNGDIVYLPDFNDAEYYKDLGGKEYSNSIKYIEDLIKNAKFYENDGTLYIELNDNHTFWDIDNENFDFNTINLEDHLTPYFDAFEANTGVKLYQAGRSGRHIVVDLNLENLKKYDELKAEQEKQEKAFIEELNNLGKEEESKEIKKESLSEESINPIINPEDKFYKDGHLYRVLLYPGAGIEMIPYYVYADYEQDALEILAPYLEENAPGLLIDIEDLEDEELDDYITIDEIHYLDYNTRIDELTEEEKEKIETEFFKNYKEED